MLKLPGLGVVAKIVMLKIRISEMAAQLRESTDHRDPRDADDLELLRQMIKFETVLADVRPLLQQCERYGILAREVGETT